MKRARPVHSTLNSSSHICTEIECIARCILVSITLASDWQNTENWGITRYSLAHSNLKSDLQNSREVRGNTQRGSHQSYTWLKNCAEIGDVTSASCSTKLTNDWNWRHHTLSSVYITLKFDSQNLYWNRRHYTLQCVFVSLLNLSQNYTEIRGITLQTGAAWFTDISLVAEVRMLVHNLWKVYWN
jgi:hypothetical protein